MSRTVFVRVITIECQLSRVRKKVDDSRTAYTRRIGTVNQFQYHFKARQNSTLDISLVFFLSLWVAFPKPGARLLSKQVFVRPLH
jgi:hypothetical protein